MTAPEDQGLPGQTISGKHHRIGGRDYIEVAPANLKMLLATTSTQELDAQAQDNGRMFDARFGMDLPMAAREQVLRLQHRVGYTDREIRRLRGSGYLRVTRTEAKLDPSPWMSLLGSFYGLTLSLFVAAQLAIVQMSAAPAWKQTLATSVLLGLWLWLGWGVSHYFVQPARLAKEGLRALAHSERARPSA